MQRTPACREHQHESATADSHGGPTHSVHQRAGPPCTLGCWGLGVPLTAAASGVREHEGPQAIGTWDGPPSPLNSWAVCSVGALVPDGRTGQHLLLPDAQDASPSALPASPLPTSPLPLPSSHRSWLPAPMCAGSEKASGKPTPREGQAAQRSVPRVGAHAQSCQGSRIRSCAGFDWTAGLGRKGRLRPGVRDACTAGKRQVQAGPNLTALCLPAAGRVWGEEAEPGGLVG